MNEGQPTRTWRKRLLLVALAVLLVVTAVTSAVLIALQTESGRNRLGDLITAAASNDHFKLELRGLGPGLPWRIRAAEFSLADERGVWLSGESLEADWSPLELVLGRIRASRVRIARLTMARVPEGRPLTEEELRQPQEEPVRPELWIKTAEDLTLPDIEVERLAVDRVELRPPLVTDPRTYSLVGSYNSAGFIGRTELTVTDLGRTGDGLTLVLARQGPPAALKVDLKVREEAGGLLGSLAGWPRESSFNLTLAGAGPLTDWRGRLEGAIENVVEARTSLRLSGGIETVFGLAGRIEAQEGVLPEEMVGYLGRSADFQIEFHMDMSGPEPVLSLKQVSVDTPKVLAKVNLTLDVGAETVSGDLVATGKDMTHLAESSGVVVENGVTVKGIFSGNLVEPMVRLTGDLGRVSLAYLSAKEAGIDLKVRPAGLFLQGLRTEGLVTFHGFESPWPELLPPDMTFNFDASLPDYARLDLPKSELAGEWLRFRANGGLDFDSLEFDLSTEAELDDLRNLPEAGLGFHGRPRARTVLSGRIPDRVSAEVTGRIEGLDGRSPEVKALLGPDVDLAARGELKEGQLAISELQVKGRSVFEGRGGLDFDSRRMNLDWQADLQGLNAVAEMYQIKASPSAQIKGKVEGTFSDFAATAEGRVAEVTWSGQKISDLKIRVAAPDLPGQIKGQAEVSAQGEGGTLEAASTLALLEKQLKFSDVKVKAPGTELLGDLAVNLQNQLTTGEARVQAADLAALGRFLGQPLAGTANLDLKLSGAGGRQGLSASGRASKIRYNLIQAETMTVKAETGDLTSGLGTKADLSLRGLRQGALEVDKAEVSVQGDQEKLGFKIRAEGRYEHPFELSATGEADVRGIFSQSPFQLSLASMQGSYGQEKVALAGPAILREETGGWAFEGLELDLASGRITGQGTLNRAVEANLTFKDVSLRPVALFSPLEVLGTLNGGIRLSGPAGDPTLEASLQASGVKVVSYTTEAVPLMDIALNSRLGQGTFQGGVDIKGLGDKPGRVEVAFPARLSLAPYLLDFPVGGQLSGRVDADLQLALLPAVLGLEGQTMAGQGRLDIKLSGSLEEPHAFGRINVVQGLYQNIDLGLYFKDIEADLTATESEIKLVKARAGDGEGGVISADGSLSLDPERKFPYRVNVKMEQARLVRLDLLSTKGAGQAALAGDTGEANLSGAVVLSPTEVNIPESLPYSVTSVEVSEINVSEKEKRAKPAPKASVFNLNLDVDLSFPEHFYVRGAGLDSEWQGAVKVMRTASAPGLRGKLDIVRGRYEFLGKDFKLTRGSLTFDGSSPPAPWINVVGESKAKDITAMVTLTGSPSQPEITLESDPPLPQDEILARVLFGKDLSNVSPVQALRLAQAANELAGGHGPKLNLLENARKELGLDQLDVRTGESGDTAVGAGKYLSEDVYVEAQGGVKPEDQKVTVEIELFPNISLETEMGADTQGGVIIQWKKDY
jgi:translocation and assembly module TamB